MSLIKNNFFNDFDKLFFPINKDFDNTYNYKSTFNLSNQVNVYTEDSNTYCIEFYLPGYSKSDINITTSNTTITVSSDVTDEDDTSRKYIQRQYRKTPFEKVWTFSPEFNLENVDASYEGGVLTLTIPQYKRNVDQRKISIN